MSTLKKIRYYCFLIVCLLTLKAQSQIFVTSGTEDTQANGSWQHPFSSLEKAVQEALPGDTIFLFSGRHLGASTLKHIDGQPNRPIVITAYDPLNIPIIDGQSQPSNDAFHPGIALDSCSWINLSAIKFENCWFSVIDIHESNYISIQNCHFTSGKYTIHPHGLQTHHVLVENSIIKHPPQVWKGWSWLEMHHGEIQYYNGALIHPRKSAGGHIMRHNELHNMFNGFRTRPASIKEDGNTEIYGNHFFNVRDNEFEPESWAWNMHYYQNDHVNVHKLFSIDGVQGGYVYIYGNRYTQDNDPWTNYQVSGIYKYKNGPLTWPCYVFNNSFYTTARVMKYGESSNHQMKHFNNAYQFFNTDNAFRVVDWQPGYEFDFDCINQGWSENIKLHHQEKNGLENTDPGFSYPQTGDFLLKEGSQCWDAGKIMQLPELAWRQTFEGKKPDIGAFEGERLVEGPPFRFIPSPEGAYYREYPRITRHYTKGPYLMLYFSSPLAKDNYQQKIKLLNSENQQIPVESHLLMDEGYALLLEARSSMTHEELYLQLDSTIHGTNHLPLVSWGSTIPTELNTRKKPNLDFSVAWNSELPEIRSLDIEHQVDKVNKKLIVEMKMDPILPIIYRGILGFSTENDVYLDGAYPEYTEHGATYTIDISECKKGKYELTLLIAGQLFKKQVSLD